MKPARTLVLAKETLSELTAAEMRQVAGGSPKITYYCPTNYCVSFMECFSRLIDPCTAPVTDTCQ